MKHNNDPKDWPALVGRIVRELREVKLAARTHFPVFDGDPFEPSDGDVWINSLTGQLRTRINGANKTITTT